MQANLVRNFIAIELPDEVKEALRAALALIKPTLEDSAIRWVPSENIHLTLKFLGEISADQKAAIQLALDRSCKGREKIPILLSGFGCFPNPYKPRILWIGLQDPSGGLRELQESVEDECAALGFERERRQFKPHLTLARIKGPINLTASIEALISSTEWDEIAAFSVDRVALMKSDLLPAGAQYTRLSHHIFQGSGPDE
jgi:2'-5' RNA ligase